MMRLTNKTALITGGNSGIGFATARLFVAEGARVAITGRNQKTLRAAAGELGDGVVAIQADVTDVEATERAVAAAAKAIWQTRHRIRERRYRRRHARRPDLSSRFRRDHPNEPDSGVLHRASRCGVPQ
jgi:NAD(P)-dependent dehydrogenase (short-subunit alcohol dehydrogenase family)